jgi:predicted transcriptional regulator of viral defense system
MDWVDKVKQIFDDNSGIVKTSQITSEGIHNRVLHKLIDEGKIVKIKRGIYQWIEDNEAEDLEILVKVLPEAILCMHSALYYYGYTDRTPDCHHIAIDRNCNKSKLKFEYPPIKPYFIISEYIKLGVEEVVIGKVKMKIFDKERTICDIIRYSNKLDREIVNKAIQGYINDNSKDIGKLIYYSKQMKVYKKVQMQIGMWL